MNVAWNDIEVFLAVARSGSLSGAGRQLNRSQPTIGRRIQQLENQLSLTLFIRTPYGYELTEPGRALVETAEQMDQVTDQFKGRARLLKKRPAGSVTVACGESFALLLMNHMDDLIRQYPDISLRIQTGFQFVNLEKGDADVAIRSRRPTSPNLYARFMGHCSYAVYGSSAYIARNSASKSEQRTMRCRWIACQDDNSVLPVTRWLNQRVAKKQIKLRCTTPLAVVQGVKSGQGLAVLPRVIGKYSSGLVELTSALTDLNQQTWLVSSRNAARIQAIKAVSTWISEIFDQMGNDCFNKRL